MLTDGLPRNVTAHDAEALGQRTVDDVYAVHDALVLREAATAGPVEADRMYFVEVGERAIPIGEVANRADRRIARMHPEVTASLRLIQGVEDGPSIRIGRWRRLRPWMMPALRWAATAIYQVASWLKLRGAWRGALGVLNLCGYWRGVLDEFGSEAGYRSFAQDMRLRAAAARELTLDLAHGFDHVESSVAGAQADAVNLIFHDIAIGRIGPEAGCEPLRAVHIQHALVEVFADRLLEAIGRQRLTGNAGHVIGKSRSAPMEGSG